MGNRIDQHAARAEHPSASVDALPLDIMLRGTGALFGLLLIAFAIGAGGALSRGQVLSPAGAIALIIGSTLLGLYCLLAAHLERPRWTIVRVCAASIALLIPFAATAALIALLQRFGTGSVMVLLVGMLFITPTYERAVPSLYQLLVRLLTWRARA